MRIGRRATLWIRQLVVTSSLLAALPGCSWIFVEAPPPAHLRREPFSCTTTPIAPVADALGAVGLGAVGGVAMYDGFTNPSPFAGLAVLFGIAFLTPAAWLAGSAVSGFEDTSECDDARNAFARPPESRPDATIPPP